MLNRIIIGKCGILSSSRLLFDLRLTPCNANFPQHVKASARNQGHHPESLRPQAVVPFIAAGSSLHEPKIEDLVDLEVTTLF